MYSSIKKFSWNHNAKMRWVRWLDLYTYLLFPENDNFWYYLRNNTHSVFLWTYFYIPNVHSMTLILFCRMYFILDMECKLLCIFQNCFCFSNPVAHITDLQAKNALLQCYSSSDRKTEFYLFKNQSCFCLRHCGGIRWVNN